MQENNLKILVSQRERRDLVDLKNCHVVKLKKSAFMNEGSFAVNWRNSFKGRGWG